jgi:asparagine synthase (glutamine-hydrolysing)
MCGIAGIVNFMDARPVTQDAIRRMLSMIRHRGPDQFGVYLDGAAGLGSARLSVLDVCGGQQPISNETGTLWIVYNGELFNYLDLRQELIQAGHQFQTNTDTEVVLHLFEEHGPDCLNRMNGQWAFAIWDSARRNLFLARDRTGIRPLFYTQAQGAFIFGSEIKALLADSRVEAAIDPAALDQVFTYWSTLTPRTCFKNILEVPPGCYLQSENGRVNVTRYWQLKYPTTRESSYGPGARTADACVEEFRELLIDATRIRLRADVPVGAYLSGGLDSSVIAAIICKYATNKLETFSIAFDDPQFDEREHQLRMARHLGTRHHCIQVNYDDIGRVFDDVVWHTETPLLRTSPAPMYLLSKLVREKNFKVVLTGEGADEMLAGYDIFKEAKLRHFWARSPNSRLRPRLFNTLYNDIEGLQRNGDAYLSAFFGYELQATDAPDYSHKIRWHNTSRTKRFFTPELHHEIFNTDAPGVQYPEEFQKWGPLERSQYLEASIFMSQYLLSSQGDRVAMAHSIEGRYPFLDYRVIEYCNSLPASLKLRGLNEKYLLRRLAKAWLPPEICERPKRAYRAPIQRGLVNETNLDTVRDLLAPEQLKASGFFNSQAVGALLNKVRQNMPIGETDQMALAGIISTQLLYKNFISEFRRPTPVSDTDDVKVCHQSSIEVHHGIQQTCA